MTGVVIRAVAQDDWPAILRLANASLRDVPGAPPQDEWLSNRKSFSARGSQHHFVAIRDGRIAGYAAAERQDKSSKDQYRLFVVVEPVDREAIGTQFLCLLRQHVLTVGGRLIRMIEYHADQAFLAYLQRRGFFYLKTFGVEDGTPVVELTMESPFNSLM